MLENVEQEVDSILAGEASLVTGASQVRLPS
jgi:hypothetical protein